MTWKEQMKRSVWDDWRVRSDRLADGVAGLGDALIIVAEASGVRWCGRGLGVTDWTLLAMEQMGCSGVCVWRRVGEVCGMCLRR